jgi:predicted Mrr-cat superfamily restriction endonuclease
MIITPEQLKELMMEVEKEDPIDFADLPFKEDDLRSLTASHICVMAESLENFSEEDRHITLLAVAAKLVLENMVLHVQLLRRHGIPLSEEVATLLQGISKRK